MDNTMKEILARIMDGTSRIVRAKAFPEYSENVNAFRIERISVGESQVILIGQEGATMISRRAYDKYRPQQGWYFIVHVDESVSIIEPEKFHQRFKAKTPEE